MTHTDSPNGTCSFEIDFLKYKMVDGRHFKKQLNRRNLATFHRITMKFGTIRNFTLLIFYTTKIWFEKTSWQTADAGTHVRGRYTQSDSATYRTGTVRKPMGVHIGATWRIRLNRPCAAAMRPYVRLLWPLAITYYASSWWLAVMVRLIDNYEEDSV